MTNIRIFEHSKYKHNSPVLKWLFSSGCLSFVVLFACCLLPTCIFSQTYWNEWINFSQKYYKIPVAQNGIYRLNYQTLLNAGISVSNIDPRNFQLFFRGQEQYIYVKGEADGSFDPPDYIEFYGQKNDGTLDSVLYKGDLYNKIARQPNPYYSLFNDTSAYFLTLNSSLTNKRIIDSPDTNYSAFAPNDYFMKANIVVNNSKYYNGRCWLTNTICIFMPEYDETEGWAGTDFGYGCTGCIPSYSQTINTSNIFTATTTNTELKIAVMGISDDAQVSYDHKFQLKYRNASGSYITFSTDSLAGYQLFQSAFSFPASSFGSSTDIMVSALSGNFSVNRLTVPYISIRYPHNLNLENTSYYEMYVPDASLQNKSYYTFTNFNDLSSATYVYDFTNHLKIPATKVLNTFKVLITNNSSVTEKFCVVKPDGQFIAPMSVKPVNSTGYFTNYSSLAADSAFIIITHKSLRGNPGADAYANYRSGINGGSHNVLLADIDELYEQFGYGIPKYPFAIRHFVKYCADNFPTIPHNLFLIGKSVEPELIRNQYADPTGNNYASSLVPTIGSPSCDNMLVSALNGNLLQPLIPIGRLAAKSSNEVNTYLNKVNEYEHHTPNPEEWMKHIIHMSGGADASQQFLLASYLKGYENTIKDTSFGGFVYKFSKNSSSPTQTSYTDSIKGLIKDGISMLTFFGHGSATLLDFNILPPDEYENYDGKYPFFTALGCLIGNIHRPVSYGPSGSETYVLHQRGMIGVFATSGYGTLIELNSLASAMYKNIGQNLYGKSIGRCIQKSIADVQGAADNPYMNNVLLAMTLHGDPSVIIHSPLKPDYAVQNSSVFFKPSYISTDMDSFNINVVVTNIGKATHDKVRVDIKRIFPDGTYVSYSDTVPYILFKDTVTFRLPVDPVKGAGLNKFEVRVDPFNTVDEIDNFGNNNLVAPYEIPLMIYSGDIIPVYPYKYAIVPKDTLTLKAYTANPFASSARYIFEIDTTDLFNSTLKHTQKVTQMGAVLKAPYNFWQEGNLVLTDSTVYFWRVRRDTTDFTNFRWRESSFQYIKNKRGWGQSHFFQFLKGDKYKYIDTVRAKRYFDLENKSYNFGVTCRNCSVNSLCSILIWENQVIQNSSYIQGFVPGNKPHILVALLNSTTGGMIKNTGTGQYGDYPLPWWAVPAVWAYEFETSTPAQQEILRRFLQDTLKCGQKFVLYITTNHNLGDIIGGSGLNVNPGLVQAFQSLGATQFPNIQNNVPYVLIGRKCGTVTEAIGNSPLDEITLLDTILAKRESGTIFSETIGPASRWNYLHWRYRSPEEGTNDNLASQDTIKITIVGIKNNGTTDTLFKNIPRDSLDINLSGINASVYPYLKLQAWVRDSIKRTPAQLKYWRIYYDGVPDAALNPVKKFYFYNPVVQQGDSIKFRVAIENIGDYNMDSLWVNYWVLDASRNKILIKSVKMDSLRIGQFLIGDVKFCTRCSALTIPGGLNSLWIEANPFDSVFNPSPQLEQYRFNNIGTLAFNVNADKINPLLDVTFDGVHIMNGDIVSAKPTIVIKLKDENSFLALDDTSAFMVYLKKPAQFNYQQIHFSSEMLFEKAVLPDNSCKITYTPVLGDGTYYLKVQAKDRSGNFSGGNAYIISFEIINKPSITYLLNYPNPFSTSTRFVFTLTGSKVPDYFRIQILTVTGKVVKDIDKNELGPLHIGRNISEYAWDGKDQFGDRLANGIYLYRVLTQLDGNPLEHRETTADLFFTQGYGKMFLIR